MPGAFATIFFFGSVIRTAGSTSTSPTTSSNISFVGLLLTLYSSEKHFDTFDCLICFSLYFSTEQITLAGFPATTVFLGTFFVTTLPEPTILFSPIVILGRTSELAPIKTLSSITTLPIFVYPINFAVLASCDNITTLIDNVTLLPIEIKKQCDGSIKHPPPPRKIFPYF